MPFSGTGPKRGHMSHPLPEGAEEVQITVFMTLIGQTDHVVSVELDSANNRFVIEHDLHSLTGSTFHRAMTELDGQIVDVLEHPHAHARKLQV
jgi:hypothetical protein